MTEALRMLHRNSPETPDLLADWRWLIGDRCQLVGWSSAGDLFYMDVEGRVWRLDTGVGEPELAAVSVAELDDVLSDAARMEDLLLAPIVWAFEAVRGRLSENQCLGFTTLPVLGGTYSVENRYAVSVAEHASLTGEIHRQIRDLPDGARVQIKIVP